MFESLLSSFPFAQPSIGTILYSTAAGIVMSFGTEFLLSFEQEDSVHTPTLQQLAGCLMLLASVMLSIIAWQMQAFQDHLVTINKDKDSAKEKRHQFLSWPRRHIVWRVAAAGLATMAVALLVLLLSFGHSSALPCN